MKFSLLLSLTVSGLLVAATPLRAADVAPESKAPQEALAAGKETANAPHKGAEMTDTQFRVEVRKAMNALESAETQEERAAAKHRIRALQELGRARREAGRNRVQQVSAATQAAREESREKLQERLRKHHESMRGELIEDHKKEAQQAKPKDPEAAKRLHDEAVRKKKESRRTGKNPEVL